MQIEDSSGACRYLPLSKIQDFRFHYISSVFSGTVFENFNSNIKFISMKKLVISSVIIFFAVAAANNSEAQVRLNVNVNIGSQPVWGPVGYDYAEYYYLPDIECYYYVPRREFVYLSGNRWVFSASLPPRYRNYDLYSGYKVVINEPRPYLHFTQDRERYSRYRGDRSQIIIRNSNDPKYYVVKGHPKYRGDDNGRRKGWDKHGHH